ncbi:MAG: Crp/Fnr family transcriptional regulator [Clostridiales bacterium]|nr:Crp/Fnr family transcriptional regulator [Clostridiales bacterium]
MSYPEARAVLAQTVLFRGLPSAIAEQALSHPDCTRRAFSKGAVIYTPQAFERSLGVLCSGAVEVTKGELIMSILRPGDLFGAAALFNDASDYATVLTAREGCSLLFFPQRLMAELMSQCPALTERYIRYLSGRIRFLSDRVEALAAGSAQQKLGQYLLRHLEGGQVSPGCSATDLAKRIGISRASLYRAFDLLEQAGAIRRDGKHIHVLNPSLL